MVVGAEIRFGGHTFAVTKVPGVYVIDGLQVKFEGTATRDRIAHGVCDGRAMGPRQL